MSCLKDAADLHADLEQYPRAIAHYERVADHSLNSALTKYSVKEYWLRSSLCALAMGVSPQLLYRPEELTVSPVQDAVTAKRNIIKYNNQDVTFGSTREAKFINVLIQAVEAGDADSFTGAVVEFDQVTKLDNWKTSMLLKIKRGLQDEQEVLR